jgi:uncharacterized membrane protein required for colicin V production
MFFDLLVILIVAGASFLGYKQGTHVEIYRLGRVFLGMTLSGLLGSPLGWKLTSMGILSANSSAIVSLIGFLIVFMLYWLISIVLVKVIVSMDMSDKKINNYLGTVTNGILALLFITFTSFISTQLSFAKDGYKEYLRDKSFSYIYMDRICRKVITADVVSEITGDGAGKMVLDKIAK